MRAIWGVAGHWHHIRAGDMRDGAMLWAIAIVSYSEGVGLGDVGACGRYGVSRTVCIISTQVITARSRDAVACGQYGVSQTICVVSAQAITARSCIGWHRDTGAIWHAEGH